MTLKKKKKNLATLWHNAILIDFSECVFVSLLLNCDITFFIFKKTVGRCKWNQGEMVIVSEERS